MIGDRQRFVQLNKRFIKDKLEDLKKVDIDIFKSGATESKLYLYKFKNTYVNNVITCECINDHTSLIKFTLNISVASFKNCTFRQFLIDDKTYSPSPTYDSDHNIIAYSLTTIVSSEGSHTATVLADAIISYNHQETSSQTYTITPSTEEERSTLENKIVNKTKERKVIENKDGSTTKQIITYSKKENITEDTSKAKLEELTDLSSLEKETIQTKIKNNITDIETLENSDGSITNTIYSYSKEEYTKYGITTIKYFKKTTVNIITYTYIQTITTTTYTPDTRTETKEFFSKFSITKTEQVTGTSMDIPIDSYRDALLNVTKLWLLSSKYDRVRHPNWAGFFDDRLRKYPMTEQGAKNVVKDLSNEISGKISNVIATNITVSPNLVERGWEVEIESLDTTNQVSTLNSSKKEKTVLISLDDDNINNVTTV